MTVAHEGVCALAKSGRSAISSDGTHTFLRTLRCQLETEVVGESAPASALSTSIRNCSADSHTPVSESSNHSSIRLTILSGPVFDPRDGGPNVSNTGIMPGFGTFEP